MSQLNYSTFQNRRPIISTDFLSDHTELLPDFIGFLAVAQKLRIPFLPVTWQPNLDRLGQGGSGQINQAYADLQTSFAFKRVLDDQNRNSIEGIFQSLISEITILRHPSIHNLPTVVELQGICWDIPLENDSHDRTSLLTNSDYDYQVWPVLVFEKSQFGDLYNFAMLPVGRELGINERLKLCVDVGTAIVDMHLNKIIHGDVKPQNVLIFQDKNIGSYSARVTDFGYSTLHINEDDLIQLPRSKPWNAPELGPWNVRPEQARKMDVFSFGLLCLWLLFEKQLSNVDPILGDTIWTTEILQNEPQGSMATLERLKGTDQLVLLAHQLLKVEEGLDDDKKEHLSSFFKASVICDPHSRDADIQRLFSRLSFNYDTGRTQPMHEDTLRGLGNQFEIVSSLDAFYMSDYRVRCYIIKCLELRLTQATHFIGGDPIDNIAFQLAICYKIGFGTARDDEKVNTMLERSGRCREQLEEVLDVVKSTRSRSIAGTTYTALDHAGHVSFINFTHHYLEHNQLRKAELAIKQEILDMETVVGPKVTILLLLKDILAAMLREQGRSEEAEELYLQVIKVRKDTAGDDSEITSTSIGNLGAIYLDQGKSEDAEKLLVHDMEIKKRILGADHPRTWNSMSNLAAALWTRGRWNEAEELGIQVMGAKKRVLGEDHPSTMISISNLGMTFQAQGLSKKAESLLEQANKISMHVLGEGHPDTLTIRSNLVTIYRTQGRLEKAEELGSRVVEAKKRLLGDENPETVASTANLASIYQSQGRFKDAETLEEFVVKTRERVLGHEHPHTLSAKSNLALNYLCQGRWDEAAQLEDHVLKIKRRTLGPEDPGTINSMGQLGLMMLRQGRSREAEQLLYEGMTKGLKVLGPEHPQTLAIMTNLSSSYRSLGRLIEATELDLGVFEIKKRTLGPNHSETLSSMSNIATTLWQQGQFKQAAELFQEAVSKSAIALGQDHPCTLALITNLGATYHSLGRLEEAEEVEARVLESKKRVLGMAHPETLLSMHNIANTWKSQGRNKEAVDLLIQVCQQMSTLLGVNHPNTKVSLSLLKEWRPEGSN